MRSRFASGQVVRDVHHLTSASARAAAPLPACRWRVAHLRL